MSLFVLGHGLANGLCRCLPWPPQLEATGLEQGGRAGLYKPWTRWVYQTCLPYKAKIPAPWRLCLIAVIFLRLQSKTFSRLLTGLSVRGGITMHPQRSRTCPNFPLQHHGPGFGWLGTHPRPGYEFLKALTGPPTSVVTVSSSIKAPRMPDSDRGPLHSVSAALTPMFKAGVNRIMEMAQPVLIPSSSQSDVIFTNTFVHGNTIAVI